MNYRFPYVEVTDLIRQNAAKLNIYDVSILTEGGNARVVLTGVINEGTCDEMRKILASQSE